MGNWDEQDDNNDHDHGDLLLYIVLHIRWINYGLVLHDICLPNSFQS